MTTRDCYARIGERIATLAKYGAPELLTDEARRIVFEEYHNFGVGEQGGHFDRPEWDPGYTTKRVEA